MAFDILEPQTLPEATWDQLGKTGLICKRGASTAGKGKRIFLSALLNRPGNTGRFGNILDDATSSASVTFYMARFGTRIKSSKNVTQLSLVGSFEMLPG